MLAARLSGIPTPTAPGRVDRGLPHSKVESELALVVVRQQEPQPGGWLGFLSVQPSWGVARPRPVSSGARHPGS